MAKQQAVAKRCLSYRHLQFERGVKIPNQTMKAAELVPLERAPAGAEERSTSAIFMIVLLKHYLKPHHFKRRPPLL